MHSLDVKPEWHAIALDVTSYYAMAEADKPYIEAILDVFIYDRNEHTYLCEMTPSHFLKYIYTFVTFRGDPDEYARDRMEQDYCYEPTEDMYLHTGDVSRVIAERPERDKLIEMHDGATIDDVVQACQENYPL